MSDALAAFKKCFEHRVSRIEFDGERFIVHHADMLSYKRLQREGVIHSTFDMYDGKNKYPVEHKIERKK